VPWRRKHLAANDGGVWVGCGGGSESASLKRRKRFGGSGRGAAEGRGRRSGRTGGYFAGIWLLAEEDEEGNTRAGGFRQRLSCTRSRGVLSRVEPRAAYLPSPPL
jgi:hypothetical protein